MQLNTVQQRILVPFIDESLKALGLMANLSGSAGQGFQDNIWSFRFNGFAIGADTEGEVNGTILMHHYVDTATILGAKVIEQMIGDPYDTNELNEDIKVALAEYSNTVIGLASRKLEESDLSIVFKSPYYISNRDELNDKLVQTQEIISIPIHVTSVGRYYFSYLLAHSTEVEYVR